MGKIVEMELRHTLKWFSVRVVAEMRDEIRSWNVYPGLNPAEQISMATYTITSLYDIYIRTEEVSRMRGNVFKITKNKSSYPDSTCSTLR